MAVAAAHCSASWLADGIVMHSGGPLYATISSSARWLVFSEHVGVTIAQVCPGWNEDSRVSARSLASSCSFHESCSCTSIRTAILVAFTGHRVASSSMYLIASCCFPLTTIVAPRHLSFGRYLAFQAVSEEEASSARSRHHGFSSRARSSITLMPCLSDGTTTARSSSIGLAFLSPSFFRTSHPCGASYPGRRRARQDCSPSVLVIAGRSSLSFFRGFAPDILGGVRRF